MTSPLNRPLLLFAGGFTAALALSACSTSDQSGHGHSDLNGFIQSFPDLVPGSTRDNVELIDEYQIVRNNEIWTCRVNQRDFAANGNVFNGIDAREDVGWPGSVIQGESLRSVWNPVTAPGGAGGIVISNINGSSLPSVPLQTVTHANVINAANAIIAQQPEQFPADFSFSVSKIRAQEDLQIALRANADWFGIWSADANFGLQDHEEYSSFLVRLQQKYYGLSFDRPDNPCEFFGEGVTPESLAPYVGVDNPMTYVSKVGYGSVFYFLVQAKGDSQEIEATINANFAGFGGGGDVEYFMDYQDVLINAYAYGGDANELLMAVLSGLDGLKDFAEHLTEAADITTGKPIEYTIRSVATDQAVYNGYALDYTYLDCVPESELCTPVQTSPQPNEEMDNGCRNENNRLRWRFRWTACDSAEEYQIKVRHDDLGLIHNATTTNLSSTYTHPDGEYFENQSHLSGWEWQVRAKTLGTWGQWTGNRSFNLEEVDSDCDTGVRLYRDHNYSGQMQFVNDPTIENLNVYEFNDILSSLKLDNVDHVVLYKHANFQGPFIVIDHDCPSLHTHEGHNWGDRVSSMKIFY